MNKEMKFIGQQSDMENEKQGLFSRNVLILCGDLVFSSMEKSSVDGLTEQKARFTNGRSLGKDSYYSYIDWNGINIKKAYIAHDQYISWGCKESRKNKGDEIIIIGGMLNKRTSNIETFSFKEGKLLSIDERNISGGDNYQQLTLLLSGMLQEKTHGMSGGNIQIFICAPLPEELADLLSQADTGATAVLYAGTAPFNKLVKRPVTRQSTTTSSVLPVVALSAAVIGLSVASLTYKAREFSTTRSQFLSYSNQLADEYAGAEPVSVLKQKKAVLGRAQTDVSQILSAKAIATALSSIPDIYIISVTIKPNFFSAEFALPAVDDPYQQGASSAQKFISGYNGRKIEKPSVIAGSKQKISDKQYTSFKIRGDFI